MEDDEEEKPDKREEIKAALAELKDHIGARGKEDAQAKAIIDTLLQEFPKSGPKDRKAIVKGLTGCLKQKRKPTKEGVIDNGLHIAAATAMGRMGPESVKSLTMYMGHKLFAKDYAGKRAIILALGNTKDEGAIDDIADLLTHHEPQVQAAAAEALQQFTGSESKVRKKIFKEVLDEVARVKNALDLDPTDPIVRQRYDGIAGPMLRTLQDLSGHEENDPTAYRSWWNDNKKRDWDAAERGK
jgi:HEAT repeat protein